MFIIPLINRFTCSEKQLISVIKNLKHKNMLPILDYVNEYNRDPMNNYYKMKDIINLYPGNKIAVKMSSLDIKNNHILATDLVNSLCEQAIKNKSQILIDAENYDIQDKINRVSNLMMKTYNKYDVNVFKTYQMYRKDMFHTLHSDFNNRKKFNEYYLGCKLVRGAYMKQDKKYDIIFSEKDKTDESYNNGIDCFRENYLEHDKLLLATHNSDSIDLALNLNDLGLLDNVEFSQLMGMSDMLSDKLAKNNKIVYKYVPFGTLYESIPYLVRRLYENLDILKNI